MREVEAKTFWGEEMNVILPEAVSSCIWRYGFFEREVCAFLLGLLQPGMIAIDVGAHLGFFTRLAALLVGKRGKVLAIEPIPYTFQRLKRNIVGLSNVDACRCAAFSGNGHIRMNDYGVEYSAFNSAFGIRLREERVPAKTQTLVETRAIDGIVEDTGYECVNLVKIDAESSEMHVLKGMTEILQKHRPHLIVEVGDFQFDGAARSEEIVRWLEAWGYSVYELNGWQLTPHKKRSNYEYTNLLFVPQINGQVIVPPVVCAKALGGENDEKRAKFGRGRLLGVGVGNTGAE